MRKYLKVLLFTIVSFCMILSGCAVKLEMPTNFEVKGNGGSVVTVGEYTYYANAYKSYSSLKSGDNKNNEKLSNISRAKTTNGKITFNDDGVIENTETVAKKVSGYEYTNLYVADKYIYFTTPNIHKTTENTNKFDYISLFKVKLDGTDLKEVLTISQEKPSIKFTNISGQDYFFYTENSSLYRVNLGKDTKTELTSDVATIVFDNDNEISTAYYTKAREDSHSGNILKTVNLLTGETSEVVNLIGVSFTLQLLSNNILFYTRTDNNTDAIYHYNDFSNGLTSEKDFVVATSITGLTLVGETVNGGIVVSYIYQENLYVKVINDNTFENQEVLKDNSVSGTATNILGAYDEYVYYLTSTGIYRVGYKQGNVQKISSKTDIKTDVFDYDGRFVYFFSKIETEESETSEEKDENYYMFMADTHYADLDEESKLIGNK